MSPEEYDGLKGAVAAATAGQLPPGFGQALPGEPPSDNRGPVPPLVWKFGFFGGYGVLMPHAC